MRDLIRDITHLLWFHARLNICRRIIVRGVTIVFDERGISGKWYRYEAIEVNQLVLTRSKSVYRIAGSGQFKKNNWSDTSQGFSEQKADNPFTMSITCDASGKILSDDSTGVWLGHLSTAKILRYLCHGKGR